MPKAKHESIAKGLNQVEKFRELARQLGADEDEEAFKAKVKKVATAPRAPRGDAPK